MSTTILQQLLERCPSDSPSRPCIEAARGASTGLGSSSSEGKALVLDYVDKIEAGPAFQWEDPALPALIKSIPSLAEVDEIEITVGGDTQMWIGLEEPPAPRSIHIIYGSSRPLSDVYYGSELQCSYSSVNDEIRATRQRLDEVDAELADGSEGEAVFLEKRLEYLERQALINEAAVLIERLERTTGQFRDALKSFGDRKRLAHCQLWNVAGDLRHLAPDLAPMVQALLADLEQPPTRRPGQ